MMKPSEVDGLKKVEKKLGKGAHSTASLVRWQGLEAVLKRPRGDTSLVNLHMEIDYLLELRGAGGAPIALGLCLRPPAQLITLEGHLTLHDYLQEEHPDEELLSLAASVLQCVAEIHSKNVMHLDLKEDNVVLDANRKVHLIDFGNANQEGRRYVLEPQEGKRAGWVAPEMFQEHRTSPAQDLYSLGYLLSRISKKMEFPEDLCRIALEFLKTDPKERIPTSEGLARLEALTQN